MRYKFSSFSILITFTLLTIIGLSLIPLLSVQLVPTKELPVIEIDYEWKNVPARIIEKEVTSKLEGVFNTVKGINSINSYSKKGKGRIVAEFKKHVDMEVMRFELANLIRQLYSSFPDGVTYPSISLGTLDENSTPILSYSIHANRNSDNIKEYTEKHITPKLRAIPGVNQVFIHGVVPFEWVITYQTKSLIQFKLSKNEIEQAINSYLINNEIGSAVFNTKDTSRQMVSLNLAYNNHRVINWKQIPIKKNGNRVLYLKDLATVSYQEAEVNSYYRVNGLDAINLVIYAKKNVNTIDLGKTIKLIISELNTKIDSTYQIKLTQDTTSHLVNELQKIIKRALFSFLILLVFVFIVKRSFKYTAILFLSIVSNLLLAVILYYLLKVELQLYSIAGITISLGIIIDNSIIVIDHIKNKGNNKFVLAILATTITTIGVLVIIFLLDKSQQVNLVDFTLIIIINISISLLVSTFYVPVLLDKLHFTNKDNLFSFSRKRRTLVFNNIYLQIIYWLKKPKIKLLLVVIFILAFGLPIQLLPVKLEDTGFFTNLYNRSIGSEFFTKEIRPSLEKFIGGSTRLFMDEVFEKSYYTEPSRTSLQVKGYMPAGNSIEQLNEVILEMESYLSQFNEIELFETQITNSNNANISIYFKKEFEFGYFPHKLKGFIETKAISFGGLDWFVFGIGRGYSNSLYSGFNKEKIILKGYHYDKLYQLAKQLKKQLKDSLSFRVDAINIVSSELGDKTFNEYHLDFDSNKLALYKMSEADVYNYLKSQNYRRSLTPVNINQELQNVTLISDNYKQFNVWDLNNTPLLINNKTYKLNQFATVKKIKSGNSIVKSNQQYSLTLAYNYIGTPFLALKAKQENIRNFKTKLPLGYDVHEPRLYNWNKTDKTQYFYILIAVGIIFFICSILLESIKQSLVILCAIPISFIGAFLTFYLFDYNFDQGGYAALILLTGISVNSILYIINDFNNFKKQYPFKNQYLLYIKAFNHKITPIVLTIISTIIGLIPFVWGGQKEVFWFSFAVGSIGGLLFSLIGVFIYLPLLLPLKK